MATQNYSITLTEKYYNTDAIDYFLLIDTTHPDYDKKNMMWPTEQIKLQEIKNNIVNNRQTIEYKVKKYEVGRLYPTPFRNTYQSMYNIIRRVVIDGNLSSVDIVNAHPTFMIRLCENYGFDTRVLQMYVDDRDNVRNMLMDMCKISKSQVKQLIITMMFGGFYEKWFIDNDLPIPVCEFLKSFHEELTVISSCIAPHFPNYQKFKDIAIIKRGEDDVKAQQRTAIALYLQDTERQVIQRLIEYAHLNDIEVVSLIHDEILITNTSKIDLSEAERYINDKTGFSVKLESKTTSPTVEDLKWVDIHKPFIRTQEQLNELKIEMTDIPEDEINNSVSIKETMVRMNDACIKNNDFKNAKYIVEHFLKDDRFDKTKLWYELGNCLHNIDKGLLDVWAMFSKRSDKFKDGECESLWGHMKNNKLNMNSLVKMARDDCLTDKYGLTVVKWLKDNMKADDDEYITLKKEFEEHSFKMIDLNEYGTWKNNRLITRKQAELIDSFQELEYIKKKMDSKGVVTEDKTSFIKSWLKDKDKRVYDTYDFLPPPLVCPETVFNVWNGYAIENEGITETDSYEFILYLIEVLTDFNKEAYNYLMNWLANIIQNPGAKCGTAVVLKSKQGGGKGTLIDIMRRIMEDYITETSNPQNDLFGNHGNAHINKLLCSLDEVKSSDTSKDLGRLKNIITSNHCIYNEKGAKQVEVRNCCNFILTTNNSFPINLDKDDRRYFVTECSNILCKDAVFWKDFYKKLENRKSIMGFFNCLKTRDISGVNWMDFPETELRSENIGASLHPLVYWMDEFIRSDSFQLKDTQRFSSKELYEDYKSYCSQNNINLFSSSAKSFGIIFKDNIDFDKCKIEKKKSNGAVLYNINKNDVFEWLLTNSFTSYETLPIYEMTADEDEICD